MYQCPSCGADLHFDPASQRLSCRYCDSSYSPEEMEARAADEAKGQEDYRADKPDTRRDGEIPPIPRSNDDYEATLFTCPQCGAELISSDETVATFCSYCDSSVMLEKRACRQRKPDYVIPFKITKEQSEEAYRKLLRRSIFAPSRMAEEEQMERFRGIYMPYWVYGFKYHGELKPRGSVEKRSGDYIYTKQYRLDSKADIDVSGIGFDSSSAFSDSLSQAIAPFDMNDAVPFSSTYLSGFYADAGDVPAEIYDDNALEITKDECAERLHRKEHRQYGIDKDTLKDCLKLEPEQAKMGYFPVWFLSSRNKKGDRLSYAVVNGQSGKVSAEVPVDFKKYILGSLILAALLFIPMNMFLLITPVKALLICGLLCLIAMVVADYQIDSIYIRDKRLNDEGYLYAHGCPSDLDEETKKKVAEIQRGHKAENKKKKSSAFSIGEILLIGLVAIGAPAFGALVIVALLLALLVWLGSSLLAAFQTMKEKNLGFSINAPFKKKIPVLIKPAFGLLIAIAVLILNPVSDVYFYAAGILCMLMLLWSFIDILKGHNLLSSRPLPQMGRRGGDENA